MADVNSFSVPLSLDLGPLIEGIKQGKVQISDLSSEVKAMGDGVKNTFGAAATIVNKFNSELGGSGKEFDKINPVIKNLSSAYAQLKNLSGGSFDATKLKAYNDGLKNAGVQLTGLVSNYAKAFDPAKITALGVKLQSTKSDFEELKTVIGFIGENISDLNLNPQEAAQLTETLTGLSSAFEKVGGSVNAFGNENQSAKARLLELKNAIAGLEVGSVEYENLTSEAAKLKNEIEEVNKGIELQASHTTKLDAGVETVEGLVAGYSVLTSVTALFGGSNEALEQSLLKVEAAMSLLQGVQQIGQLLDKGSALNIFLLKTFRTQDAAAIGLETAGNIELAAAEGTATVASEGLTAALLANPAGILLVAVAALVAGITYLAGAEDRAIEATIKLNAVQGIQLETTQKIADKIGEEQDKNIQRAKDELALASAQGKSDAEQGILKLKVLDAQKTKILELQPYAQQLIANGEDEETLNAKQLVAIKELARAEIDLTNSGRDADKKRKEVAEGNLKNITTQLKALQDFNKESDENAAATAAQLAEINNKNYIQSLKSATAIADAKLLIARKGSEQELDAAKADNAAQLKEALANVNLTEGEKLKLRVEARKKDEAAQREFNTAQLNNQIAVQESIIAVSTKDGQQEFDAKIKIIQLQAQAEILQEGLSQEKIKSIKLKAARDISDATKAFSIANNVSLINTELSAINAQLDVVKKGSEDELNLRKDAVTKQEQIDLLGAESTIKNEAEKIAKQKEIIAKGNKDKLELDKAFFESQSAQRIALAQSLEAIENARLTGAAGNLQNDPQKRFEDQQQVRRNELADIDNQLKELEALHDAGLTDENEYQTKKNNLTAAGVAKRAELQNAEVENFKKFSIKDSILKSLGLSSDDPAVKEFTDSFTTAIKDAYSGITGFLEGQAQNQIDAIGKVIDAIDQQLTAAQTNYDREKALADKGLANDLGNQEKVLNDLKNKKAEEIKAQQEAQDKLQKIKRDELKIQAISTAATNVETGINMLNAASEIFKAHAGIPFVGVALGVGFAALLVATFLSLKSAFKTPDVPTFRHGGEFNALETAPTHEQGGAGLYDETTGRKLAEFERGERLFIMNRGSSAKYAELLNAINSDMSRGELLNILGAPDHIRLPETKQLISMQRRNESQEDNTIDVIAEMKRLNITVSELKQFFEEKEDIHETETHVIYKSKGYERRVKKADKVFKVKIVND